MPQRRASRARRAHFPGRRPANAPLCTPCAAGEFTPAEGRRSFACANREWCNWRRRPLRAAAASVAQCASYAPLQGQCVACPAQTWVALLPLLLLLLLGFVVLRWLRRAVNQAVQRQLRHRVQRVEAAAAGGRDMLNQVASLMAVLSSVQVACAIVSVDFAWPLLVPASTRGSRASFAGHRGSGVARMRLGRSE